MKKVFVIIDGKRYYLRPKMEGYREVFLGTYLLALALLIILILTIT